MGQFWGENRSIKTISESVFNHFICNVNYLPWPDPLDLIKFSIVSFERYIPSSPKLIKSFKQTMFPYQLNTDGSAKDFF
jgi:hypothetical protein